MRRSIVIAVLVGALTGLAIAAGISVAGGSNGGGSSSNETTAAPGSFRSAYAARGNRHRGGNRWRGRGGRRHGHGHGHGLRFGPLAIAFKGFAERLNVSTAQLRKAAQGVKKRALDRAVADGTITADERAALEACIKSRGSGCDRAKARAAHRKLHRSYKQRARTDAAGLKAQAIDDLAAELGKSPAEVETAARAELSELLDTAVTMGFVTARGRELALACWDKPNECDRKALRAEIRKRFHGRKGGRRRGP